MILISNSLELDCQLVMEKFSSEVNFSEPRTKLKVVGPEAYVKHH